ncbi:hypothetical protein VB834_24610 [Limnoraphis robusta Tam1]|uniref:Uncharacterized protein n=1 Tax=Limnoraphis robusta CCNP1315 TaxID=3110306 RepID=A0ABU5TZ22_9CYAN|nr:hypothetical protein [Limnoraphis robusta]MEA5520194.1 hypothetical protein [Limnoraphis robusta CCNP1315]MEA5542220.1 hypothetical protein [Limnoraphis robusta Tam1]MEA5546752.1 hypothetical protein [Limnoraphis robusta CCNP1324]
MIICPLCSGELTRHVCQHKICWFCSDCRQTISDFLVEQYNDQSLGLVAIASTQSKFHHSPKNNRSYPTKKLAS